MVESRNLETLFNIKLVENINIGKLSNNQTTVAETQKNRKIESQGFSYVVLHPHQSNSESASGHVQTLSRTEMSPLTQT